MISKKEQYLLYLRDEEYEIMLNIFKERLLEFQGIIDFYFEILKNKLSKVVNFENDLVILNEDAKI